jgi:small subunit ribosomal protein S20
VAKKSKSVLKRIRQQEKRRERGQAIRSKVKTFVKKARLAIDEKKYDEAKTAVLNALKVLDKAVTKGVLHKNTANRKKSRLMTQLNKIKT